MTVRCPKCDADIGDSYEGDDPSCGIIGGWYCEACDVGYGESELGDGGYDDDVPLFISPRDPSAPIGTPISQLSGRPGHPGFEEFKRIAKSWGYD